MRLGPPPAEPEVPGQFWIDFIRDTAPVFRKPTIEQLGEFIAPTFQALIDGAKYVHPRLAEIVDELGAGRDRRGQRRRFPAHHADRPAVGPASLSCNPAEIKDAAVAPFSSGYPAADRRGWPAFLDEVRRTHGDMWADFDAFCREQGDARAVVRRRSAPTSCTSRRGSTCYSYPAEADYERAVPARPDLAPAGLDGPRRRDDLGAAGRTCRRATAR